MTKTLYLLPNVLDESQDHKEFLPPAIDAVVSTIDGIIAESEKGGRRFLKRFKTKKILQEMPVALLNEHTQDSDLKDFLPLLQNGNWGLVSDAGLSCIADPGAKLVRLCHENNIQVVAYPGPCSIILALMLSGFSGQRFSFHGYLPKDAKERERQIKLFEESAAKFLETHIFIEAPYRNQNLLGDFIKMLSDSTRFCVAWDLTLPTQGVISKTVKEWKKEPLPDLKDKPAIFLIASAN
jgi:16S rRNA (cytidine1402-2'-O)-methyltransferase